MIRYDKKDAKLASGSMPLQLLPADFKSWTGGQDFGYSSVTHPPG